MSESRRPWWKRKGWAAAGLLWLVVAYFAAVGTACYAHARGWLPSDACNVFTAPAREPVYAGVPILADGIHGYMVWCTRRGYEDAGWIVESDGEVNFVLRHVASD